MIKEVSNDALCATTTAPSPQYLRNSAMASASFGASATISSVIPVSSVIFSGIGIPGFTKVENLSVISPLTSLNAPISVILSLEALRPVVSISNTTNSPLSGISDSPLTASAALSLIK